MDRGKPVRVALIDGIVPPYRIPFLERLAACPEISVTCFHGPERPGQPKGALPGTLAVASRPIANVYARRGAPRILWQRGVFGALSRGFDVVVVSESVHNLTTWLIWLTAPLRGLRRVVNGQFHERTATPGVKERLRGWLQTRLLRTAEAVLAYTAQGRARCLRAGCPADRVFVSGNTLDVDAVRNAVAAVPPALVASTRARYAPAGGPLAVFIGRLYPAKRADLLIGAIAGLAGRGVRAGAVIIGDGPERAALEARAADLDIAFPGAIYDDAALAPLLAAADVLVVPGILGLAAVHGFAAGLPVITCAGLDRHGPEFAYLRHRENAVLAREASADAVADAILEATGDPERLAALKRGATGSASDLPMQAMVDGFVDAVLHAAGRRIRAASR